MLGVRVLMCWGVHVFGVRVDSGGLSADSVRGPSLRRVPYFMLPGVGMMPSIQQNQFSLAMLRAILEIRRLNVKKSLL
jgi:hypothetical protein